MRVWMFLLAWLWQAEPASVTKEVDELMADLVKLTGLTAPKKIDSNVMSRTELKQFIDDRLKEVVKPEEIRAEEIALKKLGLALVTFDLRKTTVDLLTEQAAAFYDYRKKKLFLLEGSTGILQRPVLVHELAHALADSHFPLEKYILKGNTDDGALARQSVMEGQATWLMTEWTVSKMGASLRKSPDMAESMNRMGMDGASGAFPVFDAAPLYVRESLLFPYSKGFLFQHAVIIKMGDEGFKEVFRRPPASSQQILHPEKYFAKVEPEKTALPKVRLNGYRELTGGSLGESDHHVLLKQYAGDKAASLAERWRGGQFRVHEQKEGKRTVLLYASEWETEKTAGEFLSHYLKALKGKWKTLRIASESPDEVIGEGDDGWFRLNRQGARVTSIEGLEKREW